MIDFGKSGFGYSGPKLQRAGISQTATGGYNTVTGARIVHHARELRQLQCLRRVLGNR